MERPLVRLPLQVGTTATWAAARAALALAPGVGLGFLGFLTFGLGSGELTIGVFAASVLFLIYAGYNLRLALRTRASDLLVFRDHLRIEGGRNGGMRIAWTELRDPWSGITDAKSERLILWKLPITAIGLMGGEGFDPTSKRPIWQLWVGGPPNVYVAETDRPDEARSLRAAAATIAAICAGQGEVGKTSKTEHASCSNCNAPLVPDDAEQVVCGYCHETVALPPKFREKAAAIKALEKNRVRANKMIRSLLEQPTATRTNLWLLVLSIVMFAAWPIGWYAVARQLGVHSFAWRDFWVFASPVAVVLAGFLFARGRLADRRAMQLLTLGYGAVAPAREGEPARCRRCEGPLPEVGLLGVASCRYCGADSIVGVDLRPDVDRARKEESSFERTLQIRRRERLLWSGLTVIALGMLAVWAVGLERYVR